MLDYLGFAMSFVGGAVGVALWLYATGKLAGSEKAKVNELERRLDSGGRRLSDLTSKLMILPGTMMQVQEDLTRMRIEIGKMGEFIAQLRVDVAVLKEQCDDK